jgi:ABC-type phosphate transport system ATPase subunit
VNGITDKNEIEERVVTIEQVALWDEVKDKLKNQLLNFWRSTTTVMYCPCSRN